MEQGYAVVTGASQGLGEAVALDLARRGFGIVGVARTRDKLDAVMAACGQLNGGRSVAILSDLGATGAVDELVDQLAQRQLPVQVLVNNAGYAVWGRFHDKPLDEHRRMMHLNVEVPVELTHRLLPLLRRHARSYILNVGSVTGYTAIATLSSYAASKAFIRHWSRSLRMDLKGTGVSVCCVCPGTVLTGFTEACGRGWSGRERSDISRRACDGHRAGDGHLQWNADCAKPGAHRSTLHRTTFKPICYFP